MINDRVIAIVNMMRIMDIDVQIRSGERKGSNIFLPKLLVEKVVGEDSNGSIVMCEFSSNSSISIVPFDSIYQFYFVNINNNKSIIKLPSYDYQYMKDKNLILKSIILVNKPLLTIKKLILDNCNYVNRNRIISTNCNTFYYNKHNKSLVNDNCLHSNIPSHILMIDELDNTDNILLFIDNNTIITSQKDIDEYESIKNRRIIDYNKNKILIVDVIQVRVIDSRNKQLVKDEFNHRVYGMNCAEYDRYFDFNTYYSYVLKCSRTIDHYNLDIDNSNYFDTVNTIRIDKVHDDSGTNTCVINISIKQTNIDTVINRIIFYPPLIKSIEQDINTTSSISIITYANNPNPKLLFTSKQFIDYIVVDSIDNYINDISGKVDVFEAIRIISSKKDTLIIESKLIPEHINLDELEVEEIHSDKIIYDKKCVTEIHYCDTLEDNLVRIHINDIN